MEDGHLANLSAYLVRRLKNGKYKIKHSCDDEPPCINCEVNLEMEWYFVGWIHLIEVEQNRRIADIKRPG